MKRQGLISGKDGTLQAALIEDGAPVEFRIFREGDQAGAVYLARVTKVERGANAAFLDLGGSSTFLPFRKARKLNPKARNISEAVREGEFLVARLGAESSETEKLPLAEALPEPALKGKPGLLREPPSPLARALSFLAAAEDILVEGRMLWLAVKKLAPGRAETLRLYNESLPTMEAFGVAAALDEARAGVIALPRGGSITIEETRAIAVIDVNGGVLAPLDANLGAAPMIARALRFQNIGGLIAVDFIDLASKRDRAKLEKAFHTALARDPAPVEREPIDRFGIVTLRRKRTGPTLRAMLEGKA